MRGSTPSHLSWIGLWIFLTVVTLPPARAQSGNEPIVTSDLLELKEIGDVTVSPGMREVLYTVKAIVPREGADDEFEYRSQLYLVEASGRRAPYQLTHGKEGASEPAWHPDGDRIAFIRRLDGKPQIFVLSLQGGEAYPVTRAEHGASAPRWSPDGTRLLYASSIPEDDLYELIGESPPWPSERPGLDSIMPTDLEGDPDGSIWDVRAWLERNARAQNPRVFSRLNLQGELGLEARLSYRHFFVQDLGADGRGGSEAVMITTGFYSFDEAEWLQDGERIVVSGKIDPTQHPDRVEDQDLYLFDVTSGAHTTLVDLPGYEVSRPRVSPDGRTIAFLARSADDPGFSQTVLGVVPVDGSRDAELLTESLDRSVREFRWSAEGWHLYFTAPSNGGFPLYRVAAFEETRSGGGIDGRDTEVEAPSQESADGRDLQEPPADDARVSGADPDVERPTDDLLGDDDGPLSDGGANDEEATSSEAAGNPTRVAERLTSFERGIGSFDVGRGDIFYVGTEAANPYELFVNDVSFSEERRLSDHNASWLADKQIVFPEERVLRRDTLEIQYWIMRPAFQVEGESYPLLVQMHGGPAAMWGPGEATMWHEFQFFAHRGYGIVYANPRGSGGYGHAFQRANYQDWGEGPAGDILAVSSEAAEEPWVDADRQLLTGGSYAGYLTAWIVAHDDRFRAAVAQRGVYDLATFLGEGNAWRLVPWHFGGFPWDVEPDTVRISPDKAVWKGALTEPDVPFPDTIIAETRVAPADSILLDHEAERPDTSLEESAGNPGIESDEETPMPEDTLLVRAAISEILALNSPLTFVRDVRTPLLIIHADDDRRTGVVQSEVLYRSLKILGRPVEYVRYPNAGHELSRTGDPRQRMDRLLRIYEFFERFLE